MMIAKKNIFEKKILKTYKLNFVNIYDLKKTSTDLKKN
jgi:hypothetical protein